MKKETGDIKFNNASELKEYLVAKKENLTNKIKFAEEIALGAQAFSLSTAAGVLIAENISNMQLDQPYRNVFGVGVAAGTIISIVSNIVQRRKNIKLTQIDKQIYELDKIKDDPEKLEAICGIEQTIESSESEEVLEN